ncbi:MAG: hypothetical protein AB8I40_05435 [Anaerolineales bacterium]|jgi:hypothetical protein
MPEDKEKDLPQIGYQFHYPEIGHADDKFRLDIYLSSELTELHFDVLRATFLIRSPRNTVTNLKVLHPWKFEENARVCPGPVIMEDRIGKKEEAFSFGGQLKIDLKGSTTTCSLVSTAPILHLTGGTKIDELFVEEVEILLAQERAKIADSKSDYDMFCLIDPLNLYIACLDGLKKKIQGFKHGDEHYHDLLGYVETQEHRLEAAGLLKETPKTFEDFVNG